MNNMITLAEIYKKYTGKSIGFGDKGTEHSYIEVYEEILKPYRKSKNVLEIGIGQGHSLRMWDEYFSDAKVYGVNTIYEVGLPEMIYSGNHNIKIFDTLELELVEQEYKGFLFDVIFEDASHLFYDSIALYNNFKYHVKAGGIYIIEDVNDIDTFKKWFDDNVDKTKIVEVIDRREIKNRYDDVLIIIKDRL
jgi:SAM-dependent methyltransferase